MKDVFVGYYRPSDDEFITLWTEARVVVDANVLLAVYGVSPSTRDALLELLNSVRTRLWIPHQFAFEYQRNRLAKILEQVKHYDDAHKELKGILEDQFRARTRHPFVSSEVEKGLEKICKKLLEGKAEQEKLLSADPHFDKLTELFAGRVGAKYNDSDLVQIYEAARKRFDDKMPPGFKDSDKPEPARYSDYVGWRQILDLAHKDNASVILVTDDAKEDWWRKEGSQTLGPRPELIVEFRSESSGLFYMYPSDRFLELSGKYLGGTVNPTAISELKERRESERPTDSVKSVVPKRANIQAAKPTEYLPRRDEAGSTHDTPKLTPQENIKPEEK